MRNDFVKLADQYRHYSEWEGAKASPSEVFTRLKKSIALLKKKKVCNEKADTFLCAARDLMRSIIVNARAFNTLTELSQDDELCRGIQRLISADNLKSVEDSLRASLKAYRLVAPLAQPRKRKSEPSELVQLHKRPLRT